MGLLYASKTMRKKVKECISCHFQEDSVVTPNRIKRVCGIDYHQAQAALNKIAKKPRQWIDISTDDVEAKSRLVRCTSANEWFYDDPGDEYVPCFPRVHDVVSKLFPRVHDAIHGRLLKNEADLTKKLSD